VLVGGRGGQHLFNSLEGGSMAKGMKCRVCGQPMYAEREDDQPQGRWVYYACRNRGDSCTNREKVFEKYADAR